MEIECTKCGKIIANDDMPNISASISGSIMGDEYVETYFYCKDCEVYTIEIYHDRFLGEDDIRIQGPVSKIHGDEKIKIINKCNQPWIKKSRANAHLKYFGSILNICFKAASRVVI